MNSLEQRWVLAALDNKLGRHYFTNNNNNFCYVLFNVYIFNLDPNEAALVDLIIKNYSFRQPPLKILTFVKTRWN